MKFSTIFFVICGLLMFQNSYSQEISGSLSGQVGKEIELKGFEGLYDHSIATKVLFESGGLKWIYSKEGYIVGYLLFSHNKSF